MGSMSAALVVAAGILIIAGAAVAELTPPYFNLAEGRQISATATCGVDTEEPELYCKLVGANTETYNHSKLIQGQVCDVCDPNVPERNHPPKYAIDGTSNWWQSPPLSRGMKYNEVNLTIDFGQEFHVAYLFIRMGNSPRPGLWTLEKSNNYGKTWTSWQHFSDSQSDCEAYFGKDSLRPITQDDDVICTTEYSKIVPLEDGEIPVMLLNNRPSAANYFNSTVLQEWTRATNVRFRFLRTKNLLGHLMSVARQDPSVTRRYFYSIRDISIGGRCMCNGHADTCHVHEPSPNRVLACQCRHNTCGIQCADCCPGFEQKKWRQNTNARPFQCEPCNCFGHSNTCVYDEKVDENSLSLDISGKYEGGGVCQNCQHNTEGINCNKCKDRFYRPYGSHWNETNVCKACNCDKSYSTGNCREETGHCECAPAFQEPDCQSCSYGHFGFPNCQPCVCNLNGTDGYFCERQDGRCPCKKNFGGDFCKECAERYYGFPECNACECNVLGSLDNVCNLETGQCQCNSNFDGQKCDLCKDGYFSFPQCLYCDCDLQGTVGEVCSKESGQCICKDGFGGPRCDQCLPGFFNYPHCEPCNCTATGSTSKTCDANGRCPCLSNFAGKQCTLCSPGYYDYPKCLACNCDPHGAPGISCNNDGQCLCSSNFDGKTCDQCKESFYNFPACEECNCDPAGVIAKFAGCGSVPAGQLCQCKSRVAGRICNECKPLFWNLNVTHPEGCEECECFMDGTIGALDTCESKTGQCACKPNVDGRGCDTCKDGAFDLFGSSLFGCKDCGCDIGGSISTVCNKGSGQCKCHPRVSGRTCSHPLTTHYFPTLYQNQFEYEDGYTPSGADVRYQFDEDLFPGFSKRGYAKFSTIQNEVRNEISITKSSVYRMVIRYVNPTSENVIANILIASDNPSEADQEAKVLFKPTIEPQFVTVAGAKAEMLSPFVLDGGRYVISIKTEPIVSTDKFIFLDYFVLLPQAYYEGTKLTKKIESPCEIGDRGMCRHYKYPSIIEYNPSYTPLIRDETSAIEVQEYYEDVDHLGVLGEIRLPSLKGSQQSLAYVVNVQRTGPYIVIVDYVTERSGSGEAFITRVKLVGSEDDEADGTVILYPCVYTMICRQPVTDKDSKEKVFWLDTNVVRPIEISGVESTLAAIKSIAIVPVADWSIDLITPSPVCVMQNGQCVQTSFLHAPNSKKTEIETDREDRVTKVNPTDLHNNSTKLVYLDNNDSTVEIRSKVPEAGIYHIVIQYFQPNHHQFSIDYSVNNGRVTTSGKLPLRNCPSNVGCRVLVRPTDNLLWFDIEESATITFTNTQPRGVWLDYVLLVPVSQLEPVHQSIEKILHEEPFDQTKEFIQQCGKDHFHIQLNASEFCKQAVFSLTSDYNHGALPCNCNYAGSHSFECDPFGGQCQCKENIIGRQCDSCRTGFYGFPECKPCDCPSTALCQKDTGECICPPRVTGEKCDKCEQYTFGFDQIVGCELCNCNPDGVEFNDLQCDLNNGTCGCRPNIEGRTCDQCINGHHNFPHCDQCRCNTDGTTFEICNQQDESCYCKKNVQPGSCDTCVEGTYNLDASNPDGCTKCFCFGKTSRCDRSFLRPVVVGIVNQASVSSFNEETSEMERWPLAPEQIAINETLLEIDFGNYDEQAGLVYFGMIEHLQPQQHHLNAYGGELSYTLFYSTGLFGNALYGPDVILESQGKRIVHHSYAQPANAIPFVNTVRMIESQFQTISGGSVSREVFMQFLHQLDRIYIRATYQERTVVSRLGEVNLVIAEEDLSNQHLYAELPIERCACPPGYAGHSCESCADGFYRDPSGPYGGYCLPCQCNGHAETCDCNTGICQNCQDSTHGDHCEKCIVGYHGNATIGTQDDCLICACPLPVESNNFATSCDISNDGTQIHCTCREGYTGSRCQSCAAGYFGRPEVEGEVCKPCECSGNIDSTDSNACDSVNGACLQCQNNTFGTACNLCAPGFYGDAIKLKDCQNCVCDEKGTAECDSYIGSCECKPNVIGEKCDRCDDDHYGFESGYGCTSCDCGTASNSTQCDDHSGECRCKPGVTGRQCDKCMRGFWNYTSEGCSACACNTEYSRGSSCNVNTGQCECLPGVIGEKCESCPNRWVLLTDAGCQECGVCHHALLDVTDHFRDEIDPVISDFSSTARGYYTAQKLVYLNETVDKYEPEVQALNPHSIDLSPLKLRIDTLQTDLKSTNRRIQYGDQRAKDLSANGVILVNQTKTWLDAGKEVKQNAAKSIAEIDQLAESFDTSENYKVENAISEAEQILQNLHEIQTDKPTKPQFDVEDHLNQIDIFGQPVKEQHNKLNDLRQDFGQFSDKLESLFKWSVDSNKKIAEARQLLDKNQNATVNTKFETVKTQANETLGNIENTVVNAIRGNVTMDEIKRSIANLKGIHEKLSTINEKLSSSLPNKYEEITNDSSTIIEDARQHSEELEKLADKVSNEQTNISENSETALQAANAYTNIVDAVGTAVVAVKDAQQAAGNATELCDGIDEHAGKSDQVARNMLDQGREALNKVQANLQPHSNETSRVVRNIVDTNTESDKQITTLDDALNLLTSDTPNTQLWQQAHEQAVNANKLAQEALAVLKPISADLPIKLENAKKMPKLVDDANKDILQVTNQMDRVNTLVPSLETKVQEISRQQDETIKHMSSLGENVSNLRDKINQAREIANNIKVGVTFQPSTTLELKAPSSELYEKEIVSIFVKTENPNGFIMYLGNENKTTGRRNKRNDFIALEVQGGHPILTINTGDGPPQRIVSKKHIADNKWHQIIVEKVGPEVLLIVREENDNGEIIDHTEKADLPKSDTIHLDADRSKLYVGGYPPDFQANSNLKESSFEGQMENLRLLEKEVGLWNFVDAQDNRNGALERDRIVEKDVPTNGYRFNGHGYVMLDAKQYNFQRKSSINFMFKVRRDANDGLIFYNGRDDSFISLELLNGGVSFKYKLGQQVHNFEAKDIFNDDQWHKVEAERDGRLGILKIDDRPFYMEENMAAGEDLPKSLKVSDTMYFGGYPGELLHSELTKQSFDGCIKDVQISNIMVDLSKNKRSYGVRPGCPDKFSSAITFGGDVPGYWQRDKLLIANHFLVNLEFKTKRDEGLIFYGTDHAQDAIIGLSLSDGSLVLNSNNQILSTSPHKYNDDEWHYVTAVHEGTGLKIIVDGQDSFNSDFETQPLNINAGDIYIGGLPNRFIARRNGVASSENFIGCIKEVTIDGHIVNFAQSTNSQGVQLDTCRDDIALIPRHHDEDNSGYEIVGNEFTKDDEAELERKRVEQEKADANAALEQAERMDRERVIKEEKEAAERQRKEEELKEQLRLEQEREDKRNELDSHPEEPETTAKPLTTPHHKFVRPVYEDRVDPVCKLPATPDLDVDYDAGYRFGTTSDSRIEFMQIPAKIKNSYEISLRFRTNEADGVLFYAADSRHTDFIALYMQNGHVFHVFNCGSGLANISSKYEYNNDQWHTVSFTRAQSKGKLVINGDDEEEGESTGHTRSMSVQAPFSFGGVNSEQLENMHINLKLKNTQQFRGCIRDIMFGNKRLGEPKTTVGAIPCSDKIESGVFFGPGDGHVKLFNRFKVGIDVTIDLEIRPRTTNALLMSVHGKKSYFILQLIDGAVDLVVDNGDGPFNTTWTPSKDENLCDGEWHSIQAVKSKFVISVQVDRVSSNPGVGLTTHLSTDTTRPLFVGGHPHPLRARGLKVRKPYVGCMRNIKIKNELSTITNDMVVGDVQTGICPTI